MTAHLNNNPAPGMENVINAHPLLAGAYGLLTNELGRYAVNSPVSLTDNITTASDPIMSGNYFIGSPGSIMANSTISSDKFDVTELKNRLDSMSVDISVLRAQVGTWQKTAEDLAAMVSDMVISIHGVEVNDDIEKLANRARIRNSEKKLAGKRPKTKPISPQQLHEDIASETGLGVRELQIDKTE